MNIMRVGTRRSDLALLQTSLIIAPLLGGRQKGNDLAIQIVPNDTFGDDDGRYAETLRLDRDAVRAENKRQWIHELEFAVAKGKIDVAIHSAKDYPAEVRQGTSLLPILDRHDPSDCFVALSGCTFDELPEGSVIGTKSKRRKAQVLALRPDLEVRDYVGNVMNRIDPQYMKAKQVDAVIVAHAGVLRLGSLIPRGIKDSVYPFDPAKFVPNVNQGILLAQCRSDDNFSMATLKQLEVTVTTEVFNAERAVIETMDVDCKDAPLGVFAHIVEERSLRIEVKAFSEDGHISVHKELTGERSDARNLGVTLGQMMIEEVRRAGIWETLV